MKHGSTVWSSFNGTSFIIHIATYMHHVPLKSGKWQVFFEYLTEKIPDENEE